MTTDGADTGEEGRTAPDVDRSASVEDVDRSASVEDLERSTSVADGERSTSAADGGQATASPVLEADGLAYDLDTYRELLAALQREGYEFVGFDGELSAGEVALRHDVDLSIERAVEMARVEAELGVSSTYCVLVTAPVYDVLAPENRRRLHAIIDAGHDLGLHFDPHHYWDEEPLAAEVEARVTADRRALERVVDEPVSAVSTHVPPEWALGTEYESFEHTYSPAYFSEVAYLADSSGRWRREPPFQDGLPEAMQLLVHPGLWRCADRPVESVVADVRQRREAALEEYLGPIGD